jgi:hypothetical protein
MSFRYQQGFHLHDLLHLLVNGPKSFSRLDRQPRRSFDAVTLRAGNLLGWPSPLVLSGSQDPAGCACIPPGDPPSQNQPNRIGVGGVTQIEAHDCLGVNHIILSPWAIHNGYTPFTPQESLGNHHPLLSYFCHRYPCTLERCCEPSTLLCLHSLEPRCCPAVPGLVRHL